MPTLVPGQLVEKYKVVRLIASGGFGAVYEVFRDDLKQRGAMKVLTLNPSPELVQRILNEARVLGALRHPNIPQIYDVGSFPDGAPWMVMEHLEGESLEARLIRSLKSRQHGLPFADVMEIGEDITAAMNAAHEKGIIHRDMKPSNVMLVADAKAACGARAVVLDFGIARMADDRLTQTGALLGTPAYMAPEQAVDARTADALSDLYSVGMVLYQCLAGRPPFDIDPARGPYGVLLAKAAPPEPLAQHAPHVPAEIQTLIMRTLLRDPAQRPSMGELEETLGRYRPPRRTGKTSSSHVVSVSSPLPPAKGAGDSDELDPTSSVSEPLLSLPSLSGSLLQSGTPSEQQARGEVSPGRDAPALVVPTSISDVPSRPMALPPLKASPNDRTAQPAPTQGVPAALASPNAKTASAMTTPPEDGKVAAASRGIVLALAGVAVLLSVALTGAVWLWPQQKTAPTLSSPAEISPTGGSRLIASPDGERFLPTGGEVGGAADGRGGLASKSALPPVSPPAVGDGVLKPPLAATPEKPPAREKPIEKTSVSTAGAASSSIGARCRAVSFSDACIHGKGTSSDVQRAVLAALRERPLRLCSGDRVIIGMGANGVRVLEAPSRLSDAAQQDFLLTLRGYLDVTPRSGKIEIQCPDRDR